MTLKNKYPRGSEWGKWDLHVHTPCSIVQEYGGNTPEIWEKFISDLENLPTEFKALGINDYIFLDGYKKVLEYHKFGRLKNIDLILPIIELRLDKFASLGSDDPWKKVNFHIIFSNDLKPDVIEANFLKAIQHKLKIDAESGEEDFNEVVTHETLAELGKKIKLTSKIQIKESDIKTGFNSLAFNFEVIFEKLKAGTFKHKFLTAIGKSEWDKMRWDGSPGNKKNVINKADFVFTALENPNAYNLQMSKLKEQNVNYKLIDCSDAHKFSFSEKPERRIGNCFTWLKANTTFEGLKQVSKEFSRIYVGDLPPLLKRVKETPTKYINKVSFQKTSNSKLDEIWFEGTEVEFNPGLVSIIGNKGNGKSALSDSIGLVGNTPNFNYFSFLHKNKFRAPRPNRSESFEATIIWENGKSDKQSLSQDPHPNSTENVKYIPQGFLETLCNENHEDFEDELRNVIFTHIPDAEKFDKVNLKELEQFMTDSIQNEIQQILIELKESNQLITELEKKETEAYKAQLQSGLEQKKKELEAHNQNKPLQIEPPTNEAAIKKNKLISETITIKRNKLSEIENLISENNNKNKSLLLSKTVLNNALSSIKVLQSNYEKTLKDIKLALTSNNINVEDVLSIEIDITPIEIKIIEINNKITSINKQQDLNEPNSLPNTLEGLKKEIVGLQKSLDEPSQLYQKYLDDLARWTESEKTILGDKKQFGTIKYFEGELQYIEKQLQNELIIAIDTRKSFLIILFKKKLEILNIYKTFYHPVTEFIASHESLLETYEINLDIENKLRGFEDKFLSFISAGSKGSFLGIEEGRKKIAEIIHQNDWQSSEGIISFLESIISHLKNDKRIGCSDEKRDIEKQLKSGYTVNELYDFLFSLDYLEPSYKLKLNDKNISELSPGERGALLLIFYLALDKNNIPLVIDQPEENLDNQSVYLLLAQFIKKAKEKRQVIIVTHNPNLAVVCDADQIIHVKIEKYNKNKFIINTGALENPIINKSVVDILEGTYEAFDTRDNKYKVIPRH